MRIIVILSFLLFSSNSLFAVDIKTFNGKTLWVPNTFFQLVQLFFHDTYSLGLLKKDKLSLLRTITTDKMNEEHVKVLNKLVSFVHVMKIVDKVKDIQGYIEYLKNPPKEEVTSNKNIDNKNWFLSKEEIIEATEYLFKYNPGQHKKYFFTPIVPSRNPIFSALCTHKDLLLAGIKGEIEIENRGENPLWRFSADITNHGGGSYSDGLLSGYIMDGYRYTDPREGLDNFSACTFAYFITHSRLVNEWSILGVLPTNTKYHKYYDSRYAHGLYVVGIPKGQEYAWLQKGNMDVKLQALYGAGENFHPRIDVKKADADDEIFNSLLKNKIVVYTNMSIQEIPRSGEDHKPDQADARL